MDDNEINNALFLRWVAESTAPESDDDEARARAEHERMEIARAELERVERERAAERERVERERAAERERVERERRSKQNNRALALLLSYLTPRQRAKYVFHVAVDVFDPRREHWYRFGTGCVQLRPAGWTTNDGSEHPNWWFHDRWISLPAAAARCGIPERTLRRRADNGEFPAARRVRGNFGASVWRFPPELVANGMQPLLGSDPPTRTLPDTLPTQWQLRSACVNHGNVPGEDHTVALIWRFLHEDPKAPRSIQRVANWGDWQILREYRAGRTLDVLPDQLDIPWGDPVMAIRQDTEFLRWAHEQTQPLITILREQYANDPDLRRLMNKRALPMGPLFPNARPETDAGTASSAGFAAALADELTDSVQAALQSSTHVTINVTDLLSAITELADSTNSAAPVAGSA